MLNVPKNNRLIWTVACLKEGQKEVEPKEATQSLLLYDNTPSHMVKQVLYTSEALTWEVLSHVAYSSGWVPSDHHLFASMAYGLVEERFDSHEYVKKWLDEWFAAKGEDF